MKKKVLFVDDEPNVLQGLKRMLFGMRGEWDMEFAPGGAEALALADKTRFDVIVSDMRMPGMDGAQLLTEIRNRHPEIVRIVLSGQSDKETTMKSVGPAHQYLSKPCDADALKQTIQRACAMRDILSNETLKKVVAQLESLPSLPTLYLEIMEEINSPNCSLNKVGEIVMRDAAMTAKILQLVNSAFFGQPRRVSDPVFAVSLLGLDTIRALALCVHIFKHFNMVDLKSLRLERLWDHHLCVGALARDIAKKEGMDKKMADDAFMAGILHDLGRLVFASSFAKKYREVVDLTIERKANLGQVEREIIGASHAEIGGYLLGLWGLPDSIVEAVLFHHNPGVTGATSFSPVIAVHAADWVDESFCGEDQVVGAMPKLDYDILKLLGLDGRIPEWEKMRRKMASEETPNG